MPFEHRDPTQQPFGLAEQSASLRRQHWLESASGPKHARFGQQPTRGGGSPPQREPTGRHAAASASAPPVPVAPTAPLASAPPLAPPVPLAPWPTVPALALAPELAAPLPPLPPLPAVSPPEPPAPGADSGSEQEMNTGISTSQTSTQRRMGDLCSWFKVG